MPVHSYVNHNFYHTTEDLAILNSTWVKVAHSVTNTRFKTASLYTKLVLHQL